MRYTIIREENFLRLRISWKMVKNPNTGTGILLTDSHLKANGERSQTSNVLVIMRNAKVKPEKS